MRKLAFALSYFAYLVAVVAAVDYFVFWRPFYQRLSGAQGFANLQGPRWVDYTTMRFVGSLRGDRKSSFPSFEREKPAGKLRVCAFGDSFTYGDEVADGHDYPALLQDVFDEQGMKNVEVLNFGNSWYGFHQAYVLWDRVGRRFGCDFVLLGPDCFQSERDTTFNHSNLAFPYYMHSRYIVRGAGVLRIDPLGDTLGQRFAEYFAFRPRLPYLRFDRNPPAFLRAVLPSGRTLQNPFYYYRGTAEAEALETYRRLLGRLAREPVQALVLHSMPPIADVANAVGKPNLVGVLAPRMERFPYNAIGGHYSSFGNRWVADQYFAELASGGYRPTVLTFEDVVSAAEIATDAPAPPPVSTYARIYLRFGERRTGFLATSTPIPGERRGTPEDLAGSTVAGLVALEAEGESLVDAAWVPTPAVPRAGDRIALSDGTREVTIGTVRMLDRRAAVGAATIGGLDFANALYLATDTLGLGGGPFTITMAGTPILTGTPQGSRLQLQAVAAELRNFRPAEGEYLPNLELAETGTVTMHFEGPQGSVALPLVRWRKVLGDTFPTERHLPARIALVGGAARVLLAGQAP